MHTCTACGKTPEQTRFSLMDQSKNWRSMCNLCRNAKDRAKKAAKDAPRSYQGWMGLCADSRPDWKSL